MDEKNLENEVQEQPIPEEPVQEQTDLQAEGAIQEEPAPQPEEVIQEEPAPQPEEAVQEESAPQPEEAVQEPSAEEELGQTDKLTRADRPVQSEQPMQDQQTYQPTYNAYGDDMGASSVASNENATPKKKKGLKIALISVLCAAVAGIIALVIFLFVRKTPEEVVRLAVTNVVDEMQDADFNIYENVFGMSEYNTDDMDVEMSFSVDEIMDMVELNGSNVSLSASAEKNEAGTTDFNLLSQLTIAGKSLDANLYCIQDVLYLEVPEILDSVITLDPNNMDLSAFAAPVTDEDQEIEELYDTYMIPAKEALQEAITYEKGDKVKITNHNGETVSTTLYTMTIPTSAVKAYIQAEADYLTDCTDKYLTDEEMMDAMGMSCEEFKQIVSQLPNYYSFLFARDFVFTFYIQKDTLQRAEFQYKFSLLGVTLDVSADFMGDDYVASDVYATCDITVDDEVISLVGEYTQSSKSDELNTDASFTVLYEEAELFNCIYNENYNVASEVYHKTLTASDTVDLTNIAYEVKGRIYDVKKGEGFKADFDSITLSVKGEELIKCSAEFAIGNMGKSVTEPSNSNRISIDDINETNLEDMIDLEKLDDIFSAWESAFGLDDMASTFPEVYEEYIDDDSISVEINPPVGEFDISAYYDVILTNDKYKIEIHEPNGYTRSYADTTEIDLDNDVYSVYISLEEVADKEEKCEDFLTYYDYFGDNCKILDQSMQTAVLSDGKEIDCFVVSVLLYNSDITDMFFFYPLEDNDYVICNVEAWEADADIQTAVEEIVNDDVIKIIQ